MSRYREHLQSRVWREMRDARMRASNYECEHCGEPATQVHHVEYPQRYGDEHPDSLVAICDRCHRISHGIKEIDQVKAHEIVVIDGPERATGAPAKVRLVVDEMVAYATTANMARVLQVPRKRMEWFISKVAQQADAWDLPGPAPRKRNPEQESGRDIFLVEVYAKAMLAHCVSFDGSAAQQEDREFHQRIKNMIDWLLVAGARALAAMHEQRSQVAVPQQASGLDALEHIVRALRETHGRAEHAEVVATDAHRRIDEEVLPQLTGPKYDTKEKVTILAHAIKRGVYVGGCSLGRGGQTDAQYLGNWCRLNAAEHRQQPGPKVKEAEDGKQTSVRIEANTWERGYIDVAFRKHGLV